MAKRTPGPWRQDPRVPTHVTGGEDGKRGICSTGGYQNNSIDPEVLAAEHEANAAIIAAAPDLLEAAQEALHAWDAGDRSTVERLHGAMDKIRAAIAKAEGQR